jgi:hypothetical protein
MLFIMNRQDQNNEDLLRKYINPGMVETAPEGFTSKSMTRIYIDAETEKAKVTVWLKYRVPVISVFITTGLILAAIFIPSGETGTFVPAFWEYIEKLNFSLPQIKMNAFPVLNLPAWTKYVFVSVVLLAIFDRAVSGVFYKEKN